MLNEIYQMLDPVAFALGPVEVRWYGLAYIAGFFCSGAILLNVAKRWKLRFDEDAFLTIVLCVVIGVIFGGRLGYVLFYGDGYYFAHPEKILAFNEGGMSFHGGLIGVLIAGVIACRMTHLPFLTLADMACIAVPIGLFFGRCANFVNGELWGAPTDLPWGVIFGGSAGDIPRHPSQLYEALLEGIVMFVILYTLSFKKPVPYRGTFFGLFFMLYGIFRFAVEFIRQPDAQLGYLAGGWLTMGQVLSIPLILIGIGVLLYVHKMKLPQKGLPSIDGEE